MRLIDADEIIIPCMETTTDDYRAQSMVDEAPTVEAVPVRHGRWIKMSDADGIFYGCSECGEWHKETSGYCPYCGAKMDGERRDDE